MNILGLNYYYHDTAASIVSDGQLIVAIEEERLSRDKHTWCFPIRSAARAMEVAGLTPKDIDHIALSIKPSLNTAARLLYGLKNFSNARPFIKHELIAGRRKQLAFRRWFNHTFADVAKKPQVHFIPHHVCHAVGSFLVSPYEKAALLGIDGAGEWATSYMGYGDGTHITEYRQSYFPNSLGSFYEAITQFCGFKPNYDEGKTMGLAPMGDPQPFYDKMSQLIAIDNDGEIKIDLSYFSYQFWGGQRYSQKFIDTFGQPRDKNGEFKDNHLNVAAAAQRVLEERILELSNVLHDRSGADYLVMAGGVARNSVANGRVVREGKFKDVYVMPAAGDNGTGIGASYYVYNKILKQPRNFVHLNPYVGNSYSNAEILKTISECKLNAEHHEDICSEAARLLHAGNILGWFQGNMEIGPRSLGNRSILADPTAPAMKDKINAEVKHREAYRPFAPSCTVEAAAQFFETEVEDPFMLKVCFVRPEARAKLPAITHVDGSARLQTVQKTTNPRYHELLSRFGELSGAPVLLNTSFNIMGEPIVESPHHAIRCFFSTGLDILVLGNYVIRK
ncbi:MAG: carbamoyltransferase C-terminal domain-containing protein [Gammaproteobacteria bacterium]|nr:carbamoyltransferase C-terminal domain-containing protein [Gammaproteobacteria bacterium]